MPPRPADRSADKQLGHWVITLARGMDSRFRIPGTSIRFGLDPIIGIVPVLGDTVTFGVGLAMLAEGARLCVRTRVYFAMIGNLLLDWTVGLIPGLDLIADTAVKAHTKNAELLRRHASGVEKTAIHRDGTNGDVPVAEPTPGSAAIAIM